MEQSMNFQKRVSASVWTGRVLSALAIIFFLMDGLGKLFKSKESLQATVQLGYSESSLVTLGIVLLACAVLYVIPRTAALGAVLLTGYLGGAVAANLRIESPLFSHVLFPVYMGVFVWLGLWLRDSRVRRLLDDPQS